jgi:cytoskeletal protein RodZ
VEKLDSAQLDQLKEIGTYLRQVRQEQSKSLEEIATKTCIRLPLLRAIELGQSQVLPEPVFVQGFIRRYADVLGLDGIGISRTFPVHSPLIDNDLKSRGELSAVAYAAPVTEVLEESKYSLRSSREFSDPAGGFWRSKAAYALYAALGLGAIGYVAYALSNPGQSPDPAVSTSPAALSQPPSPVSSISPVVSPVSPSQISAQSPEKPAVEPSVQAIASPSPAALSSPTDPNAPVKVEMKLIGKSWVQVLVDGEVQFEGMLAEGTQRSWSAKKEITVVAGNAGAVSVLANGGTAAPMGNLGDVQEKTFTASANQ